MPPTRSRHQPQCFTCSPTHQPARFPPIPPADIIIVEGYKREKHPKIELRRSGQSDNAPLAPADSTIIAVAADHAAETGGLPLLQIDNTVAIADFILGALPLEQTAR